MPEGSQKASLRDVLNYEAETYFSDEELSLIRSTFQNNPRLMKVLRKALIPTFSDLELPLEDVGKDLWLVGRDYAQIPDAEIKSIVLARQEAIKFIAGGLINLKVIANAKDESPMEAALRRSKDSTK